MSQKVDRTGERTLAVVTKADMAPQGLLEKVTVNAVNIQLGYVCVRNRIGEESYDQAREEETRLFSSDPLLSKIDKSMVGIPVLAQKLMQIQAACISRCLPDIANKINEKLNRNTTELDQMPQNPTSFGDAIRAFIHMLSSAKESLRNILIRGEYDDDSNEQMHGRARLADMLFKYSKELPSECPTSQKEFLIDEIKVLEESNGIGLPNFMSRSAFITLLRRKLKHISDTPIEFMTKVWGYLDDIVLKLLMKYSDNYPQLQLPIRRASHNIIEKMKKRSLQAVKEMIEMETIADFTLNPDYMKTWKELMEQQESFMEAINKTKKPSMQENLREVINKSKKPSKIYLNGFGEVEIEHLRQYSDSIVEQAFDMRMRLTVYWKIVVLRLADELALHVLRCLKVLVEDEVELEMVNEVVGTSANGIEKMLEESPAIASKRERLKKSIELLKESKQVVANIMDRIRSIGE
ncbi:uncharacterized protein A4U43_C03F19280 [Asparagus officinalis]|uniref:GED domain-containing protein n=2 Tax=Asparagus officinalis TaxID=4686 RepID=A0A5P1FE55_ASPOF|nr:uncharacterized protein A4U43_C03F19280 [Asparagus officinalis]